MLDFVEVPVHRNYMAGVDGNRTHRGLIRPTTGFEVQERHQAASYPHVIEEAVSCHDLLYQEKCQKTRLLSCRLPQPAWKATLLCMLGSRPAMRSFAAHKAEPYCPLHGISCNLPSITLNSCIITEKSSREVLP